MLVQKKSKQKQIVLIAIIVVLMSGTIYLLSQSFKETEEPIFSLDGQPQNVNVSSVININTSIFGEKQLTELKDRSDLSYTSQHPVTTYDQDKLLPPEEISVFNPQVGKKLILYWQKSEKTEAVKIYRSQTSGEIGEVIAAKIKGETNYQDYGLENNATYYYTVRAVNEDSKESENNNQVSAIPTDNFAPKSPSGVVINATSREVKISWVNPSDSDFDHVRIYRSQNEGELGSLISDEKLTESKFIDQNIQANVAYYYTLTSVDETGNESEKSLLPPSGNATPFEPAF